MRKKGKSQTRRKCLQYVVLTKGLYPEYVKNAYKSIIKKNHPAHPNGQKSWTDTSSKIHLLMANNAWKGAQVHKSSEK